MTLEKKVDKSLWYYFTDEETYEWFYNTIERDYPDTTCYIGEILNKKQLKLLITFFHYNKLQNKNDTQYIKDKLAFFFKKNSKSKKSNVV